MQESLPLPGQPSSQAALLATSDAQARVDASATPPFAYAIGLDALALQTLCDDLCADLPGMMVHRLRSLLQTDPHRPAGPAPALVMLDLNLPALRIEVEAAQAAWGKRVLVVGVGRDQPFTLVWTSTGRPDRVELGPAFLRPYLHREQTAPGI